MLEKASVIKLCSTKDFCMEFVCIGDSSPLAQNDSRFDEIDPSLSVILEGVKRPKDLYKQHFLNLNHNLSPLILIDLYHFPSILFTHSVYSKY